LAVKLSLGLDDDEENHTMKSRNLTTLRKNARDRAKP
jgi:hypothetical protein